MKQRRYVVLMLFVFMSLTFSLNSVRAEGCPPGIPCTGAIVEGSEFFTPLNLPSDPYCCTDIPLANGMPGHRVMVPLSECYSDPEVSYTQCYNFMTRSSDVGFSDCSYGQTSTDRCCVAEEGTKTITSIAPFCGKCIDEDPTDEDDIGSCAIDIEGCQEETEENIILWNVDFCE